MKTFWLAPALAAFLLSGAAGAATMKAQKGDAADPMMMVATPDFVKTVMSSNEFEIQSSQMADKKASSADVKQFAVQMIKDHTKAGADLKAALEKSKMTPPAAMLAPKHEAMLKQLESADGKDFEMLYIDMQADAHKEAVSLFQTYAGSGDDKAVKSFAEKTLPTLEMHKMHVMKLVAAH